MNEATERRQSKMEHNGLGIREVPNLEVQIINLKQK